MAKKAILVHEYVARIPVLTWTRLLAMSEARETSVNREITNAIDAALIEYTAEIAEDFGVAESDQVVEN